MTMIASLTVASGAGCQGEKPGGVGERCAVASPCAKGLRCSTKKKCYLPVDCRGLKRKLRACLGELVAIVAPHVRRMDKTKRATLLAAVGKEITDEVIEPCLLTRAGYIRKHQVKRDEAKSKGEDPDAKEINACLTRSKCGDFARCILKLGKLIGKKSGVTLPKPVPLPGPPAPAVDAGVPGKVGGADAGISSMNTGIWVPVPKRLAPRPRPPGGMAMARPAPPMPRPGSTGAMPKPRPGPMPR